MAGGLLTDLYELNMAASYLRRGMNGPATFSLFVRRLPADRGFLVAAGLEDCLQFLEGFSLTAEDLGYLRQAQRYDETSCGCSRGCGSPETCGRCLRDGWCSRVSHSWK